MSATASRSRLWTGPPRTTRRRKPLATAADSADLAFISRWAPGSHAEPRPSLLPGLAYAQGGGGAARASWEGCLRFRVARSCWSGNVSATGAHCFIRKYRPRKRLQGCHSCCAGRCTGETRQLQCIDTRPPSCPVNPRPHKQPNRVVQEPTQNRKSSRGRSREPHHRLARERGS